MSAVGDIPSIVLNILYLFLILSCGANDFEAMGDFLIVHFAPGTNWQQGSPAMLHLTHLKHQ